MKKQFLICLLLVCTLSAEARLQGLQRLDSLVRELNSDKYRNKNDTGKRELLRLLSYGYTYINPDDGLKYGLLELKLAQALHINSGIATAYGEIGKQYYAKGLYPTALDYEFKGLKIADSMHVLSIQSQIFMNIGKVYFRLREYKTSLEYLFKAEKISREQGYQETLAGTFRGIGAVYQELTKTDSAIAYDTVAYRIFIELGAVEDAIQVKVNLANVYGYRKDYNKACDYYLAAIKENEKIGNLMVFENSYGGLGFYMYKEAMDTISGIRKSVRWAKLLKSIEYYNKAIGYAGQLKDAEDMMYNKRNITESYMALHDYQPALESVIDYWWLRDSVLSNDNKLKIAALETKREADLKESQIKINNVQKIKERNERIFFMTGIGLLAIFIVFMFINYNRQKQAKTRVEIAKKQLEQEKIKSDELTERQKELIQEKDELMGQIEAAAKMKSKFLANVSHELRTPVTLLTGMLELMRERTKDANGQGENDKLNVAYKNSRKLQEMVEEILDLSRLENNNIRLNSEPKELAPVVKRMVYAFETFIEKEKLTLEYADGAGKGLCIEMDEDKFEKIINNLVYNAIKFNQKGGWIKVTVCRAVGNKHATIKISNSGIGIREEDLPHIFERFYQGNTYGAKAEGAGIGLSLVKEFTMLMGGTVSVSSSPVEGTTFTLQFPVSERGTLENEAEEVDAALPALVWEHFPERQTVLLVEDNDEMRYYLREILGGKVNIAEAGNGREALKWLETHKPDLVISDIMMPEMDGKAFIAHLKQDDRLKKLPVITLTALADTDSQLGMLRLGVDDYIVKPFNADELRIRAYNLLNNLEARKQFVSLPAEPDDVPAESKEADEFRNKITLFVLARMKTINVSVYDLAYELGMSERQLYRLAKSLTGCTPAQLIKEVRLQKAYELLAGGTVYKLEAVAKQVGFEDSNYFARQFYERFGKRATEFF